MTLPALAGRLEFVSTDRGLVLWADSLATLRGACPWLTDLPSDTGPCFVFAHPSRDFVFTSTVRVDVDDIAFPIAGRDVPALAAPTWWREAFTRKD